MKHKLIINQKQFNKKPTPWQSSIIQNEIKTNKCEAEVNISALGFLVATQGMTFRPCYSTYKKVGTTIREFKDNKTGKKSTKEVDIYEETIHSASLIVLDIDNTIDVDFIDENGKKGIKKAKSPQGLYVSVEDFISNIPNLKYKPALIYKSFSNKDNWNKYRVVYQLNEAIDTIEKAKYIRSFLLKEVPYADIKANTLGLYYGSNAGVSYEDNEAFINVSEFDFTKIELEDVKEKINKTSSTIVDVDNSDKEILTKELVLERLDNHKREFKRKNRMSYLDYEEGIQILNESNLMTIILDKDVNTRFRCFNPSHEDLNPSARISEDLNDGIQRYICNEEELKGLPVVSLVSKLLKISPPETRNLIAKGLGLKVGSEYQNEMTDRLNCIYEYFYKMEQNYFNKSKEHRNKYLDKNEQEFISYMNIRSLINVYELILNHVRTCALTVEPLGPENEITFFLSVRTLSSMMIRRNMRGCSVATVNQKLNTLKEMGLISSISISDVKTNVAKNTIANMISNGHTKHTEFYILHNLNYDTITKVIDYKNFRKETGYKAKTIKARVNAFGVETTKDINKQFSNKIDDMTKCSKINREYKIVLKASESLLDTNKYFTEKDLVYKIRRNLKVKTTDKQGIANIGRIVKEYLPRVVIDMELKRSSINKELRQSFWENESIALKEKSRTLIFHI